jgi:hypothetical protein
VQFPFLAPLIPRQRKALAAVELIRQTTNDLIKQCKEMVDEEEMNAAAAASAAGGEYLNKGELCDCHILLGCLMRASINTRRYRTHPPTLQTLRMSWSTSAGLKAGLDAVSGRMTGPR